MKVVNIHAWRLGLVVAGLLLVAACASVPAPTHQLDQAKLQVKAAEDANASQFAPLELSSAHQYLSQAEDHLDRGRNESARQLANQSLVDARLAQLRSKLAQTKQAIDTQKDEGDKLAQQLEEGVKSSAHKDNAGVAEEFILPSPDGGNDHGDAQ